MAYEIAIHHHERWDGNGYPSQLAGDRIPLSARIVSVADVYDALRSKRIYKPAFSHEKSMEIILEGRGTQFDPDVVDAFVRIEGRIREVSGGYAGYEDAPPKIETHASNPAPASNQTANS
jgi:putative two-component system response regulator